MTTTDITKEMDGISTNPAMIIKAVDHVVQGTEIVSDTDYLGGKALRGLYTGQKLFETKWLAPGILTGNVLPILFFSDGGGTTLVDAYDEIEVLIYRRAVGNTDASTYKLSRLNFLFNSTTSNSSGTVPYDQRYQLIGARYYYFNKEYEYKFVAYVRNITSGGYMDVEGLKFQYMQQLAMSGPAQYISTLSSEEGPELVQMHTSWTWTATSDAGTGSANTGRIRAVLPVEIYDGDGTSSQSGLSIVYGTGFTGFYASNGILGMNSVVDGIHTSVYAGTITSNSTWLTSKVWLGDRNTYTAEFYGIGFANSTQYWFTTTIFGQQNPLEV